MLTTPRDFVSTEPKTPWSFSLVYLTFVLQRTVQAAADFDSAAELQYILIISANFKTSAKESRNQLVYETEWRILDGGNLRSIFSRDSPFRIWGKDSPLIDSRG